MKKRYMTVPKRSAWLFVFLFLLAACSERDDSSIPATDVSTDPGISTVRLAMWNIRIFSDNSRDDDELQLIANVLIEYDFIAIVELPAAPDLDKLRRQPLHPVAQGGVEQ